MGKREDKLRGDMHAAQERQKQEAEAAIAKGDLKGAADANKRATRDQATAIHNYEKSEESR